MRDPLGELKKLGDDVSTRPLPPTEVRRRGERMRHRRTFLQATGAAAAVGVIVAGGALVSGDLTGATPPAGPAIPSPTPPAPTPEPAPTAPEGGWVTTIPDDFTLDDGLPKPGGDDGERTVDDTVTTAWAFDPCHGQAPGEESRTDYREVSQAPLEQLSRRQLALYPDAAAASKVVDRFEKDLSRCPNRSSEGGAADVWERYGTAFADADETLSAVRHIEQDGLLTTGAAHYAVVRVGNAVLVSSYEGEFGAAAPANVEMTVTERESDAKAIADRMCVFSADGCGDVAPAAPDPLPYILDAEALAVATEVSGWQPVEDLLDHPMVCAEESTEALAGNRTDTRQFAVMDGEEVRAMATTTVLAFDPTTWRTDAYDRAAGWLATCDAPLDREHPVVSIGDPYGELHSGRTQRGPWSWRTVMTAAPEICEECDAAWNNHQGVALADDRLVLLQVSYPTEMGIPLAEPDVPFRDVLGSAVALASEDPPEPAQRLGPTGTGDVELGTSVPELQAMGYVLGDRRLAGCYHLQEDNGGVSGYVSDTDGVVLLWAEPPMTTPQRIGFGSTRDEVEAEYGPLRPGGWGEARQVSVPGHPGTSYAFEFDEDDTVMMIALLVDGQACLG